MSQASISVKGSVLLGLTMLREEPKAIVETVLSESVQVCEQSMKRF